MPKIRFLKIRFDNNIFPYEIQGFRAAVIEKTNRQSSLYHNHRNDKQVIYRYPLIQYKVTHKKASIVCLNEGTDDIHYLLENKDLTLRVGEKSQTYAIEDVQLNYFQIQTWDTTFDYSLLNWLALNQENYKSYQELNNELEKLQFLERKLTNHLLALATGIGWQVEHDILVRITQLKDQKWLPYKGKQKLLAFTLNFQSNVSLPNYIGLGKGSSVGFGVVKGIGKRNFENSI